MLDFNVADKIRLQDGVRPAPDSYRAIIHPLRAWILAQVHNQFYLMLLKVGGVIYTYRNNPHRIDRQV